MFNYYRGKQNRPLHRGLRHKKKKIKKERVNSIGIILPYFRLCRGYRLPTAQKRRIKRYIM